MFKKIVVLSLLIIFLFTGCSLEESKEEYTYENAIFDEAFCWSGHTAMRATGSTYIIISKTDKIAIRAGKSSGQSGRETFSYEKGTFEINKDNCIKIEYNNGTGDSFCYEDDHLINYNNKRKYSKCDVKSTISIIRQIRYEKENE